MFCLLRHNVTYYDLDGKTSRLNEHVCLRHTERIYLILKINYKINMHRINFKIAHIKVQALTYLVLLQNIIRSQDC